ncbi:BnaA04g10540D [Brassica napus]|uniref:BnaA04g10540D protein n=1 Tax=Brassica napus TaxID=3708 RepID=A0A078HZ26_BRANA|nr:BnaA04g10540D [Brassica napus]
MKREGKQHGMVRTYRILPPLLNPRPEAKLVNPLTCRPTAGLFTKVSSKPTNHSKFTGKCGQARCLECHMHPITKSKVKSKGSSKVRSNDVTYKMLTWQVASGGHRPGLKLSGFSATGLLDLMSDDYGYDHDYESDEEEEEYKGCVVEEIVNIQKDVSHDDSEKELYGSPVADDDDDDDGRMSFCDVGVMMMMMMDHVEEFDEEGWCLVEEMMT